MKRSFLNILLIINALGGNDYIAAQVSFEAHRGGRGAMPENTIEAMKYAIDIKEVTTLEMDVCISKDNKVVVSHDVYFNSNFTTTPEGEYFSKEEQLKYTLYSMTYDSIRKYDVGLKPHPEFPNQRKFKAVKPLLVDLIDSCENYAKSKKRSLFYNVEIKSKESGDTKYHPSPEDFVDLVIGALKKKKILKRTVIQSFDIRPLQIIHQKYPNVKLSYLVFKKSQGVEAMVKKLGFTPTTYSPDYSIVNAEMIKFCHENKMKIVPWTVNTAEEINRLLTMGVDGVISDFPELFKNVDL